MTDEEFLELKNQIRQTLLACREINYSISTISKDLYSLRESVAELECDVKELKSDVDDLEDF